MVGQSTIVLPIRSLYTQISDQAMDNHHDIKFYLQKFWWRLGSFCGQQGKFRLDIRRHFFTENITLDTEKDCPGR